MFLSGLEIPKGILIFRIAISSATSNYTFVLKYNEIAFLGNENELVSLFHTRVLDKEEEHEFSTVIYKCIASK